MTRFALLALLAAALAGCGDGESGRPVAHVGGTAITREQLDETVGHFKEEAQNEGKPFPEAGSSSYRAVERQALALLVYRTELAKSATRLGVGVTDEEVERRMKAAGSEDGAADENGGFAEDTLRSQIAYEHIYRKVTAGLPPGRRAAAMQTWLAKMQRDYSRKLSYERGFGPRS